MDPSPLNGFLSKKRFPAHQAVQLTAAPSSQPGCRAAESNYSAFASLALLTLPASGADWLLWVMRLLKGLPGVAGLLGRASSQDQLFMMSL